MPLPAALICLLYTSTGEFRYANELVEFIRAETGDWFSIEVAAYPEWHPQARSPKAVSYTHLDVYKRQT